MSYRFVQTEEFARQSRRLAKKYPSWPDDLARLLASLTENPTQGNALGAGCYKVRVAIASKGRGKSGGGRVITLVRQVANRLYLMTVYDKSEQETISDAELARLVEQAALGEAPAPTGE